jgi:hypothetical protein
MADVILLPAAAVEEVCHEEQLRIWAHDHIVGALALGDWLRDDLSYDDQIELEACMMREIKSIIEAAFDHPAAATIRRRS